MNRRMSNRNTGGKNQFPNNRSGGQNFQTGPQMNQPQRTPQVQQQQQSRPHQFDSPQADQQVVRSGECVLCKSVTVLLCQRCGDFYCSPTCQHKDWPSHRYICFQIPALVHSSARLTGDIPALNGYKNHELPQTSSQINRKWVNNDEHQTQQQQQHQNQQPRDHIKQQQQQQQQQHNQQQQQQQNRSTPPKQQKPDSSPGIGATDMVRTERASFPKNNSSILVTAMRSSNRLYVRSIESDDNKGYCEVIKAINDFGRTAGPLKTMPARNAFAITDFNQDGLYYRVQIVSARNENDISVVYYDFGNEATKKLSELKEISKSCAELKQYVIAVMLKNVPHIRDNPKLNEYIKQFEDVDGKIVYQDDDKPYCKIILINVEDSLNDKINLYIQTHKESSQSHKEQQKMPQQKLSQQPQTPTVKEAPTPAPAVKVAPTPAPTVKVAPTPAPTVKETPTPPQSVKSRPSQLAKPVMTPPFEFVTLPAQGKNLNVVVVDNSLMLFGYFGCVLSENKGNLQAIQAYLEEYEDNGRAYKPKVEEYCLAKYEDSWYRAKALSILSEEFVEVVFIDFLNESQVSIKDIRRYPMDFDLPCKTSLCMIDELPSELDDNTANFLKNKFTPGTEHTINEIKGMEEDESSVVIVNMNQVRQWLAEKNGH